MEQEKPTNTAEDIEMKNTQQEIDSQKPGTEVTNVLNADAEKKKKEKMQAAFKTFVNQLKYGCKKQSCFNSFCRKNIFRGDTLKFDNDKALFQFALSKLSQVHDPDELICSPAVTLNRAQLKSQKSDVLQEVIEDLYSFCSSFIDSGMNIDEEENKVDVGLEEEEMDIDSEVSSFEQISEEQIKRKRVLELQRLKSKKDNELISKMRTILIDYKAAKLYFKLLKESYGDSEQNKDAIIQMTELIHHQWSQNQEDQETQLMCMRGLLLLMHNESFNDFEWFGVSNEILDIFVELMEKSVQNRKEKDIEKHDLVVQYLWSLSSTQLLEYVMQLQSLITINIITGVAKMELLISCVKVLDIIHWINFTLKTNKKDQIEKKEFYNDAVNNNLDLQPTIAQWIKTTQIQIRNSQPITHSNQFNLCAYHWILNPHNVTIMIHDYNRIIAHQVRDHFIMRAFFDPQMRRNAQGATQYMMEVDRENILDDSLKKIVDVKPVDGKDQLKLPINVHFKGEPAIDDGGVRKEYFQCVMKEILNPQYQLFTYNEENRLYWFNGQTFEPNINFELVGTLMGIALYNNTFIDLPFPHACFKILLDQDVNLEDYAQWQPDTAKSLQYILDYKDHDKAPLEDVILRNFTIDVECFGAVNEVELKEGGKDIPVTRENRREFVDLFVKFSLVKQCEGQLASFKKGFNRMVDLPVLKALFDAEDLEQLLCGTRTLDFNELKSVALYANGFTPDSPMMKWFWDIVLNEWDDEMRRKLLIFTTASDRAPVNGLKTLKFVLVLEGEGDGRLPSSHTCYNQLHIPQYSSQDVMRRNLEMAIANPTGFGLV